jgi:threonyl-tRNA synthetase
MVHRSVVGSIERAVAHLVERHGGAFPGWLAPVQLVLLPLTDAEVPYAERLLDHCLERGLRAETALPSQGTLAARVRAARLVPWQAVLGPREAATGSAALRLRDGRRPAALPAHEAVARVEALVRARTAELWEDGGAVRAG